MKEVIHMQVDRLVMQGDPDQNQQMEDFCRSIRDRELLELTFVGFVGLESYEATGYGKVVAIRRGTEQGGDPSVIDVTIEIESIIRHDTTPLQFTWNALEGNPVVVWRGSSHFGDRPEQWGKLEVLEGDFFYMVDQSLIPATS